MAYENTADIAGELMSEDPAAQEMELQRKRAEERAALLAMQQIENQVASPAAVSGPTPLQMEVSQGRMYMGPNDGPALKEFEARQGPFTGPSKVVNLMPPPTGPAPTRLQELQALDRPPDATGFGRSKTLSIRPADPFSDASIEQGNNMLRVNAQMQVAADQKAGKPSSPQTLLLAIGGGYKPPVAETVPKATTMQNQNHAGVLARQKAIAKMLDETSMTADVKRSLVLEWTGLEDERLALENPGYKQLTSRVSAPVVAARPAAVAAPVAAPAASKFRKTRVK
jgi:hypothetical protein